MLKLRLLTGPRAGRQLRVSDTKPVSIGRRKGRLRLHDSRVSKNHAEIYFANDMWVLRDLGSANGTYVNRERVQGLAELEPGDLVQMGRVLIKVVRCDGIGMDTAPELPDELLSDDVLGIGATQAPPSEAEGDLDIDALFGESDSADANDDSDIFAAPATPAAVEEQDERLTEEEEETPEPMTAAFEEPVDDDDSFFGDLGEATDTTDGANLKVESDLSDEDVDEPLTLDGADATIEESDTSDPAEESDPFLSGIEEEEPEDTSDQISLQDETGMSSRNSGTTLLTAVPHEDLMQDDSESSASDDSAVMDATGEHEDSVEEDDDAPALVGLSLEHAPPQQPVAAEEEEPDADPVAEAEAEAEAEVEALVEDESEPVFELDPEPEAQDPVFNEFEVEEEAVNEVVAEDAIDALGDEVVESQASPFESQVIEDAISEDVTPADALADLTEEEVESVLDEALAELDEPAEELAEHQDDLGEASAPDLSGVIGKDEFEFDVEDEPAEIAEVAEDAVDQVEADEPTEASAQELEADPQPEPEAETVAAVEEELPEGAPEFDIDAAFDALSEGLDDSLEVPAIGAEDSDTHSSDAASTDAIDPLVGSQLDVGFIKDALSKMEEEPGQDDDTTTKASATPMMPPAAPSEGGTIQSPPPGLNPSSLRPPQEPEESYRPPGNKGRWFFSLLLLLCIGGAGVWYVTEHYDIQITGRDGATPANANAAGPQLPGQDSGQPVGDPADEKPPVIVEQPTPEPATEAPVVETPPTGPNPFGDGPVVLGQGALTGITQDATTPADPEPTPGLINPPSSPEVAVTPPVAPPTDPGPTVVPEVIEDPAVPQPPARIVFLVDASGSLVDSLPQMLVWLNRAIQTVEPDERFAIYFFKSDEPISIKPEGMIEPTREVFKRISEEWLTSDGLPVFPSGRSNPSKAIAKALTLEPTDIYLLSDDAFAMHRGDSSSAQAMELVKTALGETEARIHGVQFFYRSDDSVLETLANQTNGTFEFVRERVVPNADPIDLLEELGSE